MPEALQLPHPPRCDRFTRGDAAFPDKEAALPDPQVQKDRAVAGCGKRRTRLGCGKGLSQVLRGYESVQENVGDGTGWFDFGVCGNVEYHGQLQRCALKRDVRVAFTAGFSLLVMPALMGVARARYSHVGACSIRMTGTHRGGRRLMTQLGNYVGAVKKDIAGAKEEEQKQRAEHFFVTQQMGHRQLAQGKVLST